MYHIKINTFNRGIVYDSPADTRKEALGHAFDLMQELPDGELGNFSMQLTPAISDETGHTTETEQHAISSNYSYTSAP